MPSDSGLAARVLDKLNKVAATKDDSWKLLVLAALEGDEALTEAIDAGAQRAERRCASSSPETDRDRER